MVSGTHKTKVSCATPYNMHGDFFLSCMEIHTLFIFYVIHILLSLDILKYNITYMDSQLLD